MVRQCYFVSEVHCLSSALADRNEEAALHLEATAHAHHAHAAAEATEAERLHALHDELRHELAPSTGYTV